jgi:DNA-binding NarL/FixJ family response regulator
VIAAWRNYHLTERVPRDTIGLPPGALMAVTRVAVFSDSRLLTDALVDVLRIDPGLVVLPRDLVQLDGLDVAVVDVRAAHSAARVRSGFRDGAPSVIFVGAADDDDGWAVEALANGARGILTRSASRDDLLKAIAVVRQGGIWARRCWLNAYVQKDAARRAMETASRDLPVSVHLSPREEEVFRHAASGAANKELAQRLAISESTVKVHLTRIFQKLGVNGRAELAALYYGLRVAAEAQSPAHSHLKAS